MGKTMLNDASANHAQPPPRAEHVPQQQHDRPAHGRIDIHSHLLPGIDDGCESLEDVFYSVRRLKQAGFVGTICTPHLWPQLFPDNTPRQVAQWTQLLAQRLAEENLDYRIWPGGELRLYKGAIAWMEEQGVPTLADSNCVLCDFWEDRWPRWVTKTLDWLLEQGYTPILAHPERLGTIKNLEDHLDTITRQGVLLQGNTRSLTGEEGYLADQRMRQWLTQGRYTFVALDMHRPDTLDARLDGITLMRDSFGDAMLDDMTIIQPRKALGIGQ